MRRAVAVIFAVVGAVGLAGCGSGGDEGPVTIVSAHWEQHQAIPDFDSTPGETTDPAELDRLAEIIETHGLQGEDARFGEECDGGRSTELTYVTDTGDEHAIEIEGCDKGDAGAAIDDLVSEWRTSR